jgi:hypothetical protein
MGDLLTLHLAVNFDAKWDNKQAIICAGVYCWCFWLEVDQHDCSRMYGGRGDSEESSDLRLLCLLVRALIHSIT